MRKVTFAALALLALACLDGRAQQSNFQQTGASVVQVTDAASITLAPTAGPQPFTVTDYFINITQTTVVNLGGSPRAGDEVVITLQQDSSGGHAISFAANILNPPTPGLNANATTAATFQYCGPVGNGNVCPANDWQNNDVGPNGATNLGTNYVTVSGGAQGLANTTGFGTTAGTTYFVAANDTESAALTVSANNVSIYCAAGVVITFSGATNGFNLSGNNFYFDPGCTVDHASNTTSGTGPLFNISAGTGDRIGARIQNAGTTNPVTGTIYMTAGSQATFRDIQFTTSQTDTCVSVIPPSGTITDVRIENVIVPTFAPLTAIPCIYTNIQNGSVLGMRWLNNTVKGTTANAINFYWAGSVAVDNATGKGFFANGNKSYATTGISELFKVYGVSYANLCGNIIDDQGNAVVHHALNLGDLYDSTICGNQVNATSQSEQSISCIDCSRNALTGNSMAGGSICLAVSTIGLTANGNSISGNTCTMTLGRCYFIGATGTGTVSFNNLNGNVCIGANAAGQKGVSIFGTSGDTVDSNSVYANTFVNLTGSGDMGVDVTTFTSNTIIGPNTYVAVTTPISDLGTTTVTKPELQGSCSGTATSSTTLGLYGLGQYAALTCTSTVVNFGVVMDRPTILPTLRVTATNAGFAAGSGVVTVLKNGATQTMTCTIGTGTACVDQAHPLTVAVGDVISVQFTTGATETLAGVKATILEP